jgi:hypothetical protein
LSLKKTTHSPWPSSLNFYSPHPHPLWALWIPKVPPVLRVPWIPWVLKGPWFRWTYWVSVVPWVLRVLCVPCTPWVAWVSWVPWGPCVPRFILVPWVQWILWIPSVPYIPRGFIGLIYINGWVPNSSRVQIFTEFEHCCFRPFNHITSRKLSLNRKIWNQY